MMLKKIQCSLPCLMLLSTNVLAGPIINLNASAEQVIANDIMLTTINAEATGSGLKKQSQAVNEQLAKAMEIIHKETGVKAKTGSTYSYPVYSNKKIDRWRVSSNIELESKEIDKMSDLIGALQEAGLAISQTQLTTSLETRDKAVDSATVEALKAFNARAKTLADAFGKSYKIKEMTVQRNDFRSPAPIALRERTFSSLEGSAPSPMPVEAGESKLTVTISGIIELGD